MKLDWSSAGWRVFPDATPGATAERPVEVLDFDRITFQGPVELIRDAKTRHGWVSFPGLTLEELKRSMGEQDATQLPSDGS